MSLGGIQKSVSNIVIYPSRSNTVPFTVPSLLDKRKELWFLQKTPEAPTRNVSSVDGIRWGSEPFLSSTANNKTSQESDQFINDSGRNKSCDSLVFGIDPTLYQEQHLIDVETSFDEENIGRLWFAIQYNPETERLVVNLIQLKNLPSRVRGVNNGCDPYVRICLLPDEKRHLQSQFKKKTCNPKFDENFVFQVSLRDVSQRSLKFTVYDINRSKNHVVIGHVVYPLKMFDSSAKVVLWRDVEGDVTCGQNQESMGTSQLYVSLSYSSELCRLTVGVYAGRNFKVTQDNSRESYEFYVKVILAQVNKVLKHKKSSAVRNTQHPIFNEMFKLKLSPSVLGSVSLSIVAYFHKPGSKDVSVGRVVFGSFMFARGAELEHWEEMSNKEKEQICRWHNLA